jgi:hypothetical protein
MAVGIIRRVKREEKRALRFLRVLAGEVVGEITTDLPLKLPVATRMHPIGDKKDPRSGGIPNPAKRPLTIFPQ